MPSATTAHTAITKLIFSLPATNLLVTEHLFGDQSRFPRVSIGAPNPKHLGCKTYH